MLGSIVAGALGGPIGIAASVLVKALKSLQGNDKATKTAGLLEELFGDGDGALTGAERVSLEQEHTEQLGLRLDSEQKRFKAETDLTKEAIIAAKDTGNKSLLALAFLRGVARPLAAFVLFVVIYPLFSFGIVFGRIQLEQATNIAIFLAPALTYVLGTSVQRHMERRKGVS